MNIGIETREQIKVVNWVRQCTDLRVYHFVQEGKRGFILSTILQKMGMVAGVSDLFFPRGSDEYKGLFIELKADGGKLSVPQTKFINDMLSEGYMALGCWGSESTIAFIQAFYHLSDQKHQSEI